MVKLIPRREKFALAYLEHGNASEAFRTAYPRSLNWADSTVWARACQLLANSKVQERINEVRNKMESKAIATREEVLTVLTRILRATPAQIIDKNGCIDLEKLRQCKQEIASIEIEDIPEVGGRRYKAKFRSVEQAAAQIAKLMGWEPSLKLEAKTMNLTDITIRIVGDKE